MLSTLPAQSHFLTNKDCMEAFGYFDVDDTGRMEYEEMQTACNTMLAPAELDFSDWEGTTFTPRVFRQFVEFLHRQCPQYNVAGNLMKFIRENREAKDDDGVDLTDRALRKLFDAYDTDGTGEFSIMEMYKLFCLLKIPLELLFAQRGAMDGSCEFDEFCAILREINQQHPEVDVDDKIMGVVAGLGDGTPELPEDDPDLENDPAEEEDPDPEPPTKKALLVGINYVGSDCELGGCINDVRNHLRVLIENFGFAEENILLLTEDQDDDSKLPTAAIIRDGIQWLISDASEGDFLFFAYSGHGSQLPDKEGVEPDGKNEILCPLDLQEDWYANSISDNYLHDVFFNQLPDGVRCLCVYDCCHSGTMTDLSCTKDITPPGADVDVEEGAVDRFLAPVDDIQGEIDCARQAAADAGITRRQRSPEGLESKLVWTISGCQDNQTSADATIGGVRQGAMTWSLLESLQEGGTKGPWHLRYERLLSMMRKKLTEKRFSQRPAMGSTREELFGRYYLANKP